MFRQIWIHEQYRGYQRIFWRETSEEPVKHYQLCTVTYGTTSAPFLAVIVLEQIAKDYKETYPEASRIISEDFYVDDVLTGGSSEAELVMRRDELVHVFTLCVLELGKWKSNSNMIADSESVIDYEFTFLNQTEKATKVLGIHLNSSEDYICYRVKLDDTKYATKRKVLSDVAKIFDPLGLVSPVVIKFKTLFQELWLQNLSWDDPLPPQIADIWHKYREDLKQIDDLRLPHFVMNDGEIHLHGFSDASIKASSAVVYCRHKDNEGNVKITIVASKTRVAPLKQISLPRLKLCGALLLTRLMKTIIESLPRRNIKLHAWCDFTVVLSWLCMQPTQLKTFVANRTSEILDTLPRHIWHHVRSTQNPADCASRRIMAEQILDFKLWWEGPTWLSNSGDDNNDESKLHQSSTYQQEVQAEVKTKSMTLVSCAEDSGFDKLIQRTSSWSRLARITAYVLRFM